MRSPQKGFILYVMCQYRMSSAIAFGMQRRLLQDIKRTSELAAPIMRLEGHEGEVYTCKFSHDGDLFASAGHDKAIFLWRPLHPDCENFAVLRGHKSAILELHWSHDNEKIVSASPDKSVRAWDVTYGVQVKKMSEHTDVVNSCHLLRRGAPLVVSGSEDTSIKVLHFSGVMYINAVASSHTTARCSGPVLEDILLLTARKPQTHIGECKMLVQVWDLRSKRSVQTLQDSFQLLSVCFGDSGDTVFSAGIENSVKARSALRLHH